MKIAILTVPFNNNYGGFLQAFALKYILQSMNHSVWFIDRRRNRKDNKFIYFVKHLFHLDKAMRKQMSISKYTSEFQNKYLRPKTKAYYTSASLRDCLKYNFDCYIVGSDQVWRYQYAKENIDDYFFNFLSETNVLKISYAASFGISSSEYDETKKKICRNLLKKFDAISIREESGKYILNREFNVPLESIYTVLDPTMLLNVDCYKNLFNNVKCIRGNYIFSYILDNSSSIHNAITILADKLGQIEVNIKAQTGSIASWSIIEPIEVWLNRIYYSDFIITDSFHGMIFSIIFKKNFIVLANSSRGIDRFTSILSMLDLLDLLTTELNPSNIYQLYKKCYNRIDWNKVDKILSVKRFESLKFLKNHLSYV